MKRKIMTNWLRVDFFWSFVGVDDKLWGFQKIVNNRKVMKIGVTMLLHNFWNFLLKYLETLPRIKHFRKPKPRKVFVQTKQQTRITSEIFTKSSRHLWTARNSSTNDTDLSYTRVMMNSLEIKKYVWIRSRFHVTQIGESLVTQLNEKRCDFRSAAVCINRFDAESCVIT